MAQATQGVNITRIGLSTLVYAYLYNCSSENIRISLLPVIYVSRNSVQLTSCYWFQGYFVSDTVYAHNAVTIAFGFRSEQVPQIYSGDAFTFRWREDDSFEERTYRCVLPLPEKKPELLERA